MLVRALLLAHVALGGASVAVPTAAQLEWMDMEVGAMITYNLQTYCQPASAPASARSAQPCQLATSPAGEAMFVPSLEYAASIAAPALDTDAWARAAASFGAKYVVLVADHMTGWTLWDTAAHNFSISRAARGGDVVREMLASCRRYGLRLGVFYSVHFNWYLGVDDFAVGHAPLGPRTYTQQEYVAIAQQQLRELFTIFDEDDDGRPPYEVRVVRCDSRENVCA